MIQPKCGLTSPLELSKPTELNASIYEKWYLRPNKTEIADCK